MEDMMHLLLGYKNVAASVFLVDFVSFFVKQATTLRDPQGNKLSVDSIQWPTKKWLHFERTESCQYLCKWDYQWICYQMSFQFGSSPSWHLYCSLVKHWNKDPASGGVLNPRDWGINKCALSNAIKFGVVCYVAVDK